MASDTWFPMVKTGFSEVIGSWMMRAILLPRTRFISLSDSFSRSSPSSSMLPDTMRPGGMGMRRISDSMVTDLPEPDSPTMPSVSPRRRSKLMPSTALTVPHRVVK